MYSEYKGEIPSCLYNCLRQSLNLDFFLFFFHVQGPQAYAQDALQPLRLIVRPV